MWCFFKQDTRFKGITRIGLGEAVTELFQNFSTSPYLKNFCALFRAALIEEEAKVCCKQARQERSLVGQ